MLHSALVQNDMTLCQLEFWETNFHSLLHTSLASGRRDYNWLLRQEYRAWCM